jgi:hypothetical protein
VGVFDELAEKWEAAAGRMDNLAIDVCRAQAERFVEIERAVTPKRSGALAASEGIDAIGGGGAGAHAVVSPHKVYAEIENYGGEIAAHGMSKTSPKRVHVLAWDGGFARRVHHIGKGYVQRAEGIAQGSLTAIAEGMLAEILDI